SERQFCPPDLLEHVFCSPCKTAESRSCGNGYRHLSDRGGSRLTARDMATPAQALATAPIPPQNLDAEESVLGAMMLSPGALGAVSEFVDAGDFYRESHSRIYRAALALYAKGEPVDAITLTNELDRRGELEQIGGQERIHELAALVPATSNAAHYAKIV